MDNKSMVNTNIFKIDSDYHAEYWANRCAWNHINNIKIDDITELKQTYKNLINTIDEEIKTFTDYNKYKDTKYLKLWLNAYKTYIQSELEKLDNVGKYYIRIYADYSEYGDVNHKAIDIFIMNKTIIKKQGFYNTKEDAIKALESISKKDLENFRKTNLDSKFQPLLDWHTDIIELLRTTH